MPHSSTSQVSAEFLESCLACVQGQNRTLQTPGSHWPSHKSVLVYCKPSQSGTSEWNTYYLQNQQQ